MRVLVTGADSKYGGAWADLLAEDHDVTCLGESEHGTLPTVIANRTDYDAVRPAFDDQDVVVDLPAAGEPNADWATQSRTMAGTYNFLKAADDAGVPQYIVGSSNMVVQGYEVEHAPALYDPDYDFEIDHTAVPRPLTMYGVTRLFSEQLARRFVEAEDWQLGRHVVESRDFPERAYVLRWGSIRAWDGLDHPYGDAEYGVEHGLWTRDSDEYERAAKRMQATWLSGRDLQQLLNRMIADDTVTFDVFYGISGTDTGWLDIDHAREVLGYEPNDHAGEWDGPPA